MAASAAPWPTISCPRCKNCSIAPDPPEHIIIETSGLALCPSRLVKAFQWPDMRTRATVDGVIALIDADAVAAGRFATDEAALAAARAADPTLDHDSPLEELYERSARLRRPRHPQ